MIKTVLILVNAMHITASVFINDDECGLVDHTHLSPVGAVFAVQSSIVMRRRCFRTLSRTIAEGYCC